jgi:hypothetical protein
MTPGVQLAAGGDALGQQVSMVVLYSGWKRSLYCVQGHIRFRV